MELDAKPQLLLPASSLMIPEDDPDSHVPEGWEAHLVLRGTAIRAWAPCGCFHSIQIRAGSLGDGVLTQCIDKVCVFDWGAARICAQQLLDKVILEGLVEREAVSLRGCRPAVG